MYCPLCGNELELVERTEEQRKIYGSDYNNNEWDFTLDDSYWYYCPTNKCFGKDYPIIEHAAPGNRRTQDGTEPNIMHLRPGDSWSLTWLK